MHPFYGTQCRCADVVNSRDVYKAEQDPNDDTAKTLSAGKPDVKTSDMSKFEVRNICCLTFILGTNNMIDLQTVETFQMYHYITI